MNRVKPSIDQVEKYVRLIGDQLGLRDWRFHVSMVPQNVDDDAYAETIVTPGRRVAAIQFFDRWVEADHESQRVTVIHELLHSHVNAIVYAFQVAKEALGGSMYGVIEGAMWDRLEDAVDAIAESIAQHFPTPAW
jgi:hypothetical protein